MTDDTRENPHVVLAAGGTGGHMVPAEALAGVLTGQGHDVLLVTDRRGDRFQNICQGLPRHVMDVESHMAGGVAAKLRGLWSLLRATLAMRSIFRSGRPGVVVGFGGYPSLPPILAARLLGIPYVLHEQNAVLGRVNHWLSKSAALLALSVDATSGVPRQAQTVTTGNPVRSSVAKLSNLAYATPLGGGDIRLFVIGGSQGARILSEVVPAALASLDEGLRRRLVVTHQARAEDIANVVRAYKRAGIRKEVGAYFENVAGTLQRTQLVICRAGASTLAELAAMGRPAILVPLAIAADDHQRANAMPLVDAGGGWMMEETDFTPDGLATLLRRLLSDMGELRDASDALRGIGQPDAAVQLASHVTDFLDDGVPQ